MKLRLSKIEIPVNLDLKVRQKAQQRCDIRQSVRSGSETKQLKNSRKSFAPYCARKPTLSTLVVYKKAFDTSHA